MIEKSKNTDNKKPSFFKKFLGFFGSIVFYGSMAIIIASLATSFMGDGKAIRILGYSPYFIETFSMDSVMPAGSLVIAKQEKSGMYQIGDDISFYDVSKDGKIVTHRIVDIEDDVAGKFYVTKGVDNEKIDDQNVYQGNVIGKIVLVVPEVGIYISYIRKNIILVAGFMVGLWILIKSSKDLLKNKKSHEDLALKEVMPCEDELDTKTEN